MGRPAEPTREDPVAGALAEVVGGPAGRRIGEGRHGWWTPARVLVAGAVVTVALAALTRLHCRQTSWASPDQFTHACYSDVPTLFSSSALAAGGLPYSAQGPLAQPVGVGGLLWLLGKAVPDGPHQARGVFDLAVVVLAVALAVTVAAVVVLAGQRPWDAGLVAFSPVVVVAGVVSLDGVAVAVATVGLLAWTRQRTVLAGVLLGTAAAVQPLTWCVLLALVLVVSRRGRAQPGVRATSGTAVAAVTVWLALNAPAAVLAWEGWSRWWASAWSGDAGYGSLWLLPQLAGWPLPAGAVRWGSVLAVVLALLAVATWARAAGGARSAPAVVLVLCVAVGALLPAVPVQASLLLLPFAVLAVPRWRDHVLWGGTEVLYATGTWLYLYGISEPDRGLPAWAYATVLVARLAAWAWLAVRAAHPDDPRPAGRRPAAFRVGAAPR